MGIMPLQFLPGQSRESLGLTGEETYSIRDLAALAPGKRVVVEVTAHGGKTCAIEAIVRIDTIVELAYYRHGGILPYVIRQLLAAS
jgi:aconitate hydratase